MFNLFQQQEPEHLYVNMMPFNLFQQQSLPDSCQAYWPLIEQCLKLTSKNQTGYLTIDERPVAKGESQRRAGLHVESPGFIPVPSNADTVMGRYVPGAEHHWGGGLMMRNERVEGGIFMASNVANTTAVWNCQIHDEDGDFIGPHGDIERFRELLGPCARTLEAGELIWMTDRTPHESLPVPLQADGTPIRRQYFRLVIGTVTAWYADHSTPNPLGYLPPESVNIVRGNKFFLYPPQVITWVTGDADSIAAAYKLRQFHQLLCVNGMGHMYERFQACGIRSVADFLRQHAASGPANGYNHNRGLWAVECSADGKPLFGDKDKMGAHYYEFDVLDAMVVQARKGARLAIRTSHL